MSNRMYYKNIRRTITGSLGRFIAIMAIIALGVGFFVGVKITKASMVETGNKYVTEHNMYDFRFASTLGYTEDEEADIAAVPGVTAAEGSMTQDFFSLDRDGNTAVYRAHSVTERINKLSLVKGRLPEAGNECVGDKEYFRESDIGREIVLTDENSKDTRDEFEYRKFKLVGLVDSVYYMNSSERGTSSLGDGRIYAFLFMPRNAFTSEYYTEMYVTWEKQGYLYSDEYNRNIKDAKPSLVAAAEQCGKDRYDEILSEAREKIADAQKELDDGYAELQDGKEKLASEKKKTYKQLADAKRKLDQSSADIKKSEEELPGQRAFLESQKPLLEAQLNQANLALQQAEEELALDPDNPEKQAAVAAAQATVSHIKGEIAKIDAGIAQIDATMAAIPAYKAEIEKGYKKYRSGKAKADREFARAEAEIRDAEKELENGEKELNKARRDLEDIEEPELYTQLRRDNLGYDSFDSNSDIVDSIARVFPLFFFLIAALVCSTTMARMIEEERTQIGAFRAIGFTQGRIMWKYIIYSGLAAVMGCVIGFLLGSKCFPYAIWKAYGMIYDFAPLEFYFSVELAIASLIVSLLCSVGTTWLACRAQLKSMPAEILRPKAPKAGKRIFLERIKPLWCRLRFLHKVTARNIFRFKKRIAMMVLGIAGCTALCFAGFGILDSIAGLADYQYEEIEKYDMTAQFSENLDDEELGAFMDEYGQEVSVVAPLQQIAINTKSSEKVRSCSMMITDRPEVLQKVMNFAEGSTDGPKLDYPGKGKALINNKLADLMDVEVGNNLLIEYDDTKKIELEVVGIYRNYVNNYVYVDVATYEELMNKIYKPVMAFIKIKDADKMDVEELHAVAENINSYENMLGMQLNRDTRVMIDNMMVSLNYIVWLVITCAAVLAFIVLFNLGNINITERVREIATIEVLGFYPREIGSYVFRENIVLVVFGIIIGLPMGHFLHKFIMTQIIVDAISFNETVKIQSYIYATLMVVLFTVITDLILRKKLRKINMAEALKSIE
ncbi:MAG: FtsX-like permease family protein [Lentihominibacter sp.]|jgi:putative ABC transport system permease protein